MNNNKTDREEFGEKFETALGWLDYQKHWIESDVDMDAVWQWTEEYGKRKQKEVLTKIKKTKRATMTEGDKTYDLYRIDGLEEELNQLESK